MEESRYDTYYKALLHERLFKIRDVMYYANDIDDFYISYSGGKDSTVLSELIDMAIPQNNIPRVYCDTGIDLNMVRDFVYNQAKYDDRIHIVKPHVPIKSMLENEGYPFKSKGHSCMVERYSRIGKSKGVTQYLGERTDKVPWSSQNSCPAILKYQFTEDFTQNGIKISDKCCKRLKEDPIYEWAKEHNKKIVLLGLRQEEGGRRQNATCQVFKQDKFVAFQPLVRVTSDFIDWFIERHRIRICDIYKPPYNFHRTGCKGCPFAKDLQHELDVLEEYFPIERKQCEAIWKPVYEEYRRIGYRLKGV